MLIVKSSSKGWYHDTGIYGPFTVEYEIEEVFSHCTVGEKHYMKAAILLPDKEPQEDQETLWREVYWTYAISDYVIQELKEKFTITRKQ